MHVETIPIFNDNYAYLVVCEQSGVAAAVDPADPQPVLQRARQLDVPIVAVWTTHHHYDHAGGNTAIAEHCAKAKTPLRVLGGSRSVAGLTDLVAEGSALSLGRLHGRTIHVPGHTMDSMVYWIEDAAFTGDTLYAAGCGRPFEGDRPMLYRSLNQNLAQLAPATRIYYAHEYTRKNLRFAAKVEPGNEQIRERIAEIQPGVHTPPTTWALELATNPFLRCDQPEIQKSTGARDPVAVFGALRAKRTAFPDIPSDLER